MGRALPGVEVRIGDNRELQVRGPSVMKGYWKRAEDTARVLAPDDWLSTGDQADMRNGRIRIMGRIKEILVTSTGEKVPPGDLELAIAVDPLFAQVMVVGENQPFIGCMAVVNKAEWQRLAASLGLDPAAAASLNQASVRKAALARVAIQTRNFARYAAPRAIFVTLEPWTVENTSMTPTLKLKRNDLMARYADEVEAMYRPSHRKATPAAQVCLLSVRHPPSCFLLLASILKNKKDGSLKFRSRLFGHDSKLMSNPLTCAPGWARAVK